MEEYEGIVSDVFTEYKEPSPELIEARRIQIDSDYGMMLRHQRELERIAEQATDEEALIMAKKFKFSVLVTALWEAYSAEHEILEKIRGTF